MLTSLARLPLTPIVADCNISVPSISKIVKEHLAVVEITSQSLAEPQHTNHPRPSPNINPHITLINDNSTIDYDSADDSDDSVCELEITDDENDFSTIHNQTTRLQLLGFNKKHHACIRNCWSAFNTNACSASWSFIISLSVL